MRKRYSLFLAALSVAATSQAQFTDDIESYEEGAIFNEVFTTWDGTNDGMQNAIVSTAQAASGSKSVFIGAGGANGGPQDAILSLGGVATTGAWSLAFNMFIPEGKSAYINLQGSVNPNANANLQFLSGNINFNEENMTPGMGTDDGAADLAFAFPHGEWFPVICTVNFGNGKYSLSVNGQAYTSDIGTIPNSEDLITDWGGLDLFASGPTNEYYMDDFNFYEDPTGVEELVEAAISVYPNPAQNEINVANIKNGSQIDIYDISGKLVITERASSIQEKINISQLSAGTYTVQVTTDGQTQSAQIVK